MYFFLHKKKFAILGIPLPQRGSNVTNLYNSRRYNSNRYSSNRYQSSRYPFSNGPSGGPDRLYFDDSDVTTASVDGFDEH